MRRPEMEVGDHEFQELLEELGEVAHKTLEKSKEINAVLKKFQKGGYQIKLGVDATFCFEGNGDIEENETTEEIDANGFTERDNIFLRTLNIDPGEPESEIKTTERPNKKTEMKIPENYNHKTEAPEELLIEVIELALVFNTIDSRLALIKKVNDNIILPKKVRFNSLSCVRSDNEWEKEVIRVIWKTKDDARLTIVIAGIMAPLIRKMAKR